MKKILSYFVSFEFVFFLFLRAAEFETVPVFSSINEVVKLAGVFGAINFVQATFIVYKRYMRARSSLPTPRLFYFYVFGLFLLYILFSYVLTPNDPKANRKTLEFVTIISWCIFAGIFVINTPERARRFVVAGIVFGVFVATVAIYRFATGSVDIRQLTGGLSEGYHRLGRSTGVLVVIGIVTLPYTKTLWQKARVACLLVVAFAGLVASGQRAPWVALPLTAVALFVFHTKRKTWRIAGLSKSYLLKGTLVVVALAWGFLYFTDRGQYVADRFEAVHFTSSSNTRLYMYEQSLDRFAEDPVLGIGFGRFSRETGLDIWRHPHNLFIEILLELGVVGFLLLAFLLFWWLNSRSREMVGGSWTMVVLSAMFWFYLANAMISGSITDNRVLLSVAAILSALSAAKVSSASSQG